MNLFTESNITLCFPDTNFFRFADCDGYKALSGNHFKEMDACWYDAKKNQYWLFELKDFSLASLGSDSIETKTWDIVKKAVDSLSMFLASKHQYQYADILNIDFPIVPNATTTFKFVTIVHCSSSQKANIQLINNSFRSKFKPYAQIFGITEYGVMEHSKAIQFINDVQIQ